MTANPDQNQDDWLGELLDTLDPFVNSHNDFLRRKLIVKAGIIARHQADIERAVAEALERVSEILTTSVVSKNFTKEVQEYISKVRANLDDLTPKERKQGRSA